MKKLLALLLLVCALVSMGADYYIAPTGLATNPGTTTQPYSDLNTAVTARGPANTFIYKDGTYNAILLKPGWDGIVLKAENSARALIRPVAPYECGIYGPSDKVFTDITIQGFDVAGAKVNGISFRNSPRIKVIANYIHHNGNMGVALHYCNQLELVDNFIEKNGSGIIGPTGAGQQHSTYLSGDQLYVSGNYIANGTYGIHIWPWCTRSIIENNYLINHTGAGIVLARWEKNPKNANYIANNTCIGGVYGVQLIQGTHERIYNNVFANNLYSIGLWQNSGDGPKFIGGSVYLDSNYLGNDPILDPSKKGVVVAPTEPPVVSLWQGVTSQPAN